PADLLLRRPVSGSIHWSTRCGRSLNRCTQTVTRLSHMGPPSGSAVRPAPASRSGPGAARQRDYLGFRRLEWREAWRALLNRVRCGERPGGRANVCPASLILRSATGGKPPRQLGVGGVLTNERR